MKIPKTTITIVTEAEWHVYEILRDLPAYMRFGVEAPPSTFLPKIVLGFEAGAVNKTCTITAHKPDRHSWFMAHQDPDYHFQTMVLDIKAARETYLVEPDLREELALELSPRLIIPCITRQHDVFLWAVSLPDSSGRSNTWVDSAMEAVEKAMHGWIRIDPRGLYCSLS
jgi:hypothetical protein